MLDPAFSAMMPELFIPTPSNMMLPSLPIASSPALTKKLLPSVRMPLALAASTVPSLTMVSVQLPVV